MCKCVRICLRGLRPGEGQTNLFKARYSKFSNHALKMANNESVDQVARMHRLVCAFVVHMQQK